LGFAVVVLVDYLGMGDTKKGNNAKRIVYRGGMRFLGMG
jgi:hypothetical protein